MTANHHHRHHHHHHHHRNECLGAKEERNVLDELLGIQEDDLENDLDIGNDLPGRSRNAVERTIFFCLTFMLNCEILKFEKSRFFA